MATTKATHRRLEQFLAGLALLLLLLGCVWVVKPFWTALLWAVVLAYALFPLQRLFTRWLRGAKTLAACLVSLSAIVLVVGPVVGIGIGLAEDGKELARATRNWFESIPDQPPPWVESLPVVGDELQGYWVDFADSRRQWMAQLEKAAQQPVPRAVLVPDDELGGEPAIAVPTGRGEPAAADELDGEREDSPRIVMMLGWLLGRAHLVLIALGKALGQGLLLILMSIFIAFFLLRDGDMLVERLGRVVDRLSVGRGKHLMQVAGVTVKGVFYGILGTALVQGVVAGVGFWIAGVPGALLLAVLTFFLGVVPIGPPLVWIPATVWLFTHGRPGWGVFMALWGFFGISGVDNLVRPLLISQGSKLPLVLIICGVVGGVISFGLVGVFLGPTLLAVAYRLIEEWTDWQSQLPPEPALGDGLAAAAMEPENGQAADHETGTDDQAA